MLLLAPAVAILLDMAIVAALPGPVLLRFLLAVLLLPLVWPALMFYVYWPKRSWTPFAGLGVTGILLGTLVAFG